MNHHEWVELIWFGLLAVFAISLLTSCGDTRSFQTCLAHVVILGPATFTLTCPPPNWRPPEAP